MMSAQCEITAKQSRGAKIGFFERYLTFWVVKLHGKVQCAPLIGTLQLLHKPVIPACF